ncbi:MAG: XisH family protein [Phormidesmis sp.]
MAAKDIFHNAVRRALEKQQWTITADPLRLKFGGVTFQVDLAAEKILAADRGDEKIAVEVKSFLNPSAVTDFYAALGQFLSYRLALIETEPDRFLYLAVPLDTYQSFFQLAFAQAAIEQYEVKIMVYDSTDEAIIQWIK